MNAVITTQVFREWLHRLKDERGRMAILRRISRVEQGNFGDHKPVGEGVQELRIPVGPGYRVYYVLLVGGDKGSQKRDIATAKQMAEAIRREQ
jgi:putative addiction module killer protein